MQTTSFFSYLILLPSNFMPSFSTRIGHFYFFIIVITVQIVSSLAFLRQAHYFRPNQLREKSDFKRGSV